MQAPPPLSQEELERQEEDLERLGNSPLQKYTRRNPTWFQRAVAAPGTESGSLLTSNAMTDFLAKRLTGTPGVSVRDRLKTMRRIKRGVQNASLLRQVYPWQNFQDLPISRERELGLVPVLKPNQQSQDDYNIVVKMQRICLMLLRVHDYVKQNLSDAKFFVEIHGDNDTSDLYQLKLRWEHYEPKLKVPTLYSLVRTVPFLQKVGTRGGPKAYSYSRKVPKVPGPINDRYGDPVLEDEKPSFYHSWSALPLPIVNRRFHLTPQEARSHLRFTGNWADYPVGPHIKNQRGDFVSAAAYQTQEPLDDKLIHSTYSPGVRDEVNKGDIFEIFASKIIFYDPPIVEYGYNEEFGSIINHKHEFIGPPSAWYQNDVKPVTRNGEEVHEGAANYIKVLGLFILKLSRTPLEAGFEELQKKISISVREVQRILTMYWGNEWIEMLPHVEIKPRDFHLEKNISDMDQRIQKYRQNGNPRAMLGGNKKKLKVSRKLKSKSKKINRTYKRK
jgi:hypothetical protein